MKENSETQDFATFLSKKWRIEICFIVEKINQKKNYKEETSREHKQRVTQKEEIAFTTSFRKRYVLEKMLQKKKVKEKRRASHVSLNMQSGSLQSIVQRQINMKKVPNKKVNRQTCFFRFATVP